MKNRILLMAVAAILSCGWTARAQSPAYRYFDQAAKVLDKVDFFEQRTPKENIKLIERNASALDLIGKGLALSYRPPQEETNFELSRYNRWRQLARFIKSSGDVRAAQNDWRGAADNYVDAIKLGIEVTRGENLVGLMSGHSMQAIGRRSLEENLAHLDATVAQHAVRRLETIVAFTPPWPDVVQQELASNQRTMIGQVATKVTLPEDEYRRSFAQRFQELSVDVVAQAQRPYAAVAKTDDEKGDVAAPDDQKLDKKTVSNPKATAQYTFDMVAPLFGRVRFLDTTHRAQNQMLLAALALRAYHVANGKYPAALAELVPTYLEKVPTDPFGLDSTLRYKNAGVEYSLYSIGADGKDDGGRPVKNDGATGRQEYSARRAGAGADGDIVFGINN